jgi:N6-adenosine-specific RNA methylase IME4
MVHSIDINIDSQLSEYEKTIKEVGIHAIWVIGEQLLKAKEKIVESTGDKRAPGFIQWGEVKFGFKKRAISRYIKAFEEGIDNPKLIWGNEKSESLTTPISINSPNTCTISDLYNLIDQNKKFGTIYADPPWAYSNQATRASTNKHYPTLSPKEIAEFPISELTTEKAHLHLWTTNAFLFECPKIIEAWGFEYKGVFIWVKPQMGIGNYWRVSHEFLLLGVKGGLTFQDHSHMSWLIEDRTKHSSKPESVAQLIEKVSPSPYIELFGRRPRVGWVVYGNEIEKTLFTEEAFGKKSKL